MVLESVKVPEPMVPLFEQAESYVKSYFSTHKSDTTKGTITIGDERYILVRAKSLRLNFAKTLSESIGLSDDMAEEAADKFLYIMAKSMIDRKLSSPNIAVSIYAADLKGAFLGTLCFSIFFLPFLGIFLSFCLLGILLGVFWIKSFYR